MSKIGSVAFFGGVLASLVPAGYGTYLESTSQPLSRVHPLVAKYNEKKDDKLDLVEAVKLVTDEFDKDKNGFLSTEERAKFDKFYDSISSRFHHRNVQESLRNLALAELYCGKWSENPRNIEAIKKYWGETPSGKEILKWVSLRNKAKE